jgi:chromate transporter
MPMADLHTLLKLFNDFGTLSLQAVGGGTAVLPEMERLMEREYHISPEEFTKVYSLGQLAPGPNMTMVVVLGDRIAGVLGALVVLFAFFIPASFLVFLVGRIWERAGKSPWRRAVQDGLAPISIGLMLSGVYTLATTATTTALTIAMAIAVVVLVLRTKINPLFVVLASGVIGGVALPR